MVLANRICRFREIVEAMEISYDLLDLILIYRLGMGLIFVRWALRFAIIDHIPNRMSI